MMARDTFGPRLRHARERAGLTLESIAASTKISRSLLEALERNDLTRWPRGIYRRSFFRAYAAAIGLQTEPWLAEFLSLLPEPGHEPAPENRPALRLSLVPESRWKPRLQQGLAAAFDGGMVLLAGYALFAVSGASLWSAIAAVGLSYHAASTAVLGQSFSAWCLSGTLGRRISRSSSIADQVAALRDDWTVGGVVLKVPIPRRAREESSA
jgi:transcriptional regulator with XRE-family HTH domain